MKISDKIKCLSFPCSDVDKNSYMVPPIEIDPAKIKILMITESPPVDRTEYYYSPGNPFYLQTILQVFNDAGIPAKSMQDIIDTGFFITTAIKCGKTQYAVSPDTMKNCSGLLEKEVSLFPDVKVILLMGDVAIKMTNDIWKKQTGKKIIPAGPTYKIRGQAYYLRQILVMPSYTPAGKNFLIEKSKRRMVSEDIRKAVEHTG